MHMVFFLSCGIITLVMKSVVFCASQRFARPLNEFMDQLHALADKQGKRLTLLHPQFDLAQPANHLLHEKDRLKDPLYRAEVPGKVYDHLFRKVKVADVCFVFNKEGYVGANVNGELFAAAVLGKVVYALDEKMLMGNFPNDLYHEPSIKQLVHEIVATPEELLKRLG